VHTHMIMGVCRNCNCGGGRMPGGACQQKQAAVVSPGGRGDMVLCVVFGVVM